MLTVMFIAALVLLLGGQRWGTSPQTPAPAEASRRLHPVALAICRTGGVLGLGFWSWMATAGNPPWAALLLAILLAGLFMLLNCPLRLIVHSGLFAGGRQSPRWLVAGVLWFHWIAGGAFILTAFGVGLR